MRITIKAARVNKGISQKDAAKSLGVSNKTLSSWENGETFPNQKYIEPICELYGVPYDNLIFLTKDSLKAN